MKSMFPGFYSPSTEDIENAWVSEDTLFVFDSSTLLHLYSYASQTRDDFFAILSELSDKIWIPYFVGLEYQRNRLRVVRNEKAIFTKIHDHLTAIDDVFINKFAQLKLDRSFPALSVKTEALHKETKKLISNYKRSVNYWDKKQACVRGHDEIRDNINTAFDGKIGERPENQNVLDTIFEEGKKRYSHKMPPGFKDGKKSNAENNRFIYSGLEFDRQYGDLLVWKQIIEKAKSNDINSVILITDDAKEDWWYIIDSHGKKVIGPRAELREEICRDGEVELFTIYNTADFLEAGKKLLEIEIKDESIQDAEMTFSEDTLTAKLKDQLKKLSRSKTQPFQPFEFNKDYLSRLYKSSPQSQIQDMIDDSAVARINAAFSSQYSSFSELMKEYETNKISDILKLKNEISSQNPLIGESDESDESDE